MKLLVKLALLGLICSSSYSCKSTGASQNSSVKGLTSEGCLCKCGRFDRKAYSDEGVVWGDFLCFHSTKGTSVCSDLVFGIPDKKDQNECDKLIHDGAVCVGFNAYDEKKDGEITLCKYGAISLK